MARVNFILLVLLTVSFVTAFVNSACLTGLWGLNWYSLFGGFLSVSWLAAVYYFFYADLYLTTFAGVFGRFLALLSVSWLMWQLAVAVPLVIVRVLSLFGGKTGLWSSLTACILVGAVVMIGAGLYGSEHLDYETKELRYTSLPYQFDGTKIALITDLHIGPYYHVSDLAEILEQAERDEVDYVVLGGDLIDDVRELPALQELLKEKAPNFRLGIDYVWGNHEYFRDQPLIADYLAQSDIRVLKNEHATLSRDGATIYVAGVDFPFGRGENLKAQAKEYTDQAMAGIPEHAFVILLAHHPQFLEEGLTRHVELTLAGHTHGMQFGLAGQTFPLMYPYNRGLFTRGASVGYVSRGAGGWMPLRVFCDREVTYFTLKRGR